LSVVATITVAAAIRDATAEQKLTLNQKAPQRGFLI
jgi:hypothetical protein